MRWPIVVLAVAGFLVAPGVRAQKFKDEGLHQYLNREFGQLNDRLDKLNDRLAALDSRLIQLEKNQATLVTAEAQTENLLKANDTSLSSFRLSAQQELFDVKSGMTQLKADLASIERAMNSIPDALKRANIPPPVATVSASASPASGPPVGYIENADGSNLLITIGAADGAHSGQQFHVYHLNSNDGTESEAGTVEVVEVVEAHKSRVKIISSKPGIKIGFSDIVRSQ